MTGFLPLGLFVLALMALGAVVLGVRMLVVDRRLQVRVADRVLRLPERQRRSFEIPGISIWGRDREEIEQKLQLAGFGGADAAGRFAWLRLVATLLTIASAWTVATFQDASPGIGLLVSLMCGGLVYIGAKLALVMLAGWRVREITAEFPFLLDLILMMLQSGISLDQCFRSIAREESLAAPRHSELIAALVADVDRGMSYDAALDKWAARVAVDGARELAALFQQGLFQGIELTPALREFAAEFTQRRVSKAREAMGRITVRMVVLMIVFFMPAMFIVLGGPPLAAIFDTLGKGSQ